MSWLETDPMNERLKFVQSALSDRFSMAEDCARDPTPVANLIALQHPGAHRQSARARASRHYCARKNVPMLLQSWNA
jgi:hypothetical protein